MPTQERYSQRPSQVFDRPARPVVQPFSENTCEAGREPTQEINLCRPTHEETSSSRFVHPPSRKSTQLRTENCSGESSQSEKRIDPATQNSSGEKPEDSIQQPGEERYRFRPRKGNKHIRRFLKKLSSGTRNSWSPVLFQLSPPSL